MDADSSGVDARNSRPRGPLRSAPQPPASVHGRRPSRPDGGRLCSCEHVLPAANGPISRGERSARPLAGGTFYEHWRTADEHGRCDFSTQRLATRHARDDAAQRARAWADDQLPRRSQLHMRRTARRRRHEPRTQTSPQRTRGTIAYVSIAGHRTSARAHPPRRDPGRARPARVKPPP